MAQKWLNPADESGALDCLAGRLDGTEYIASLSEIKAFIPASLLPTKVRSQRVARGVERGYCFRWRRAR